MADSKNSGYDHKSCNALEKPFYYPIEAAIRWCGLVEQEPTILSRLQTKGDIPDAGLFPQWPCLAVNALKISDAMANGDVRCGRDGSNVNPDDHVAALRRTVRHTDLREWMSKNYPDQKPEFLFDEIERTTHVAINADSFKALQADRDALRTEIERIRKRADKLRTENESLTGERDSLRAMVGRMNAPGERAETTYLNIIGAMLHLLTGTGKQYKNQSAVVTEIDDLFGKHKQGCSQRTLEEKFPLAKNSLNNS